MKNLKDGRWWGAILWIAWLAFPATADEIFPIRRTWVLEQLSEPPHTTPSNFRRHQLGLRFDNLADTISTLGFAVIDLNYLELGIKASARTFLAFSDEGKFIKEPLKQEGKTLGLEVARFSATSKNHYGRISLGINQFFPDTNVRFLTLAVQAGAMPTVYVPWFLNLGGAFFIPLHSGGARTLIFRGETTKQFRMITKSGIQLGGRVGFVYRMQPDAEGGVNGEYENLVFSFGPLTKWENSWGRFDLALTWRLALDKQQLGKTLYPSRIRPIPDILFSWTVLL